MTHFIRMELLESINRQKLIAWSQKPYDKDLGCALTITKNGEEKLCWDIILNGTIEYLKGEKNLEQATSEISQKVNLYLSE